MLFTFTAHHGVDESEREHARDEEENGHVTLGGLGRRGATRVIFMSTHTSPDEARKRRPRRWIRERRKNLSKTRSCGGENETDRLDLYTR